MSKFFSANSFFSRQRFWNNAGGLSCAILMAIGFIYLVFPAHFIDGTHAYWLAQTEDVTQYQAGLRAFIHEPWQRPVLRIDSLNWPDGTLATFADIIPLYALVLKVFSPLIDLPFNPYGYWVGLCLLLQAISAWWILRAARINDGIVLVCLTGLLLIFPAWLSRMGHISLLSQWLITFAIALCIQEQQERKSFVYAWLALGIVSSLINLYLCAMIFCLGLAQSLYFFSRIGVRNSVHAFMIASALGLLVFFTMVWPLPPANGAPDGGFGLYSLNLLAPFSGEAHNVLHFESASAEQAFEGFNYLGIGGLLLIAGAMLGMGIDIGVARLIKPHQRQEYSGDTSSGKEASLFLPIAWPTVCALMLMGCYALSNQIFFGKALLYTWSLPSSLSTITGQFRASGRFFWPLGYALLICSVIMIVRVLPRRIAHGMVIGALILQTIDLWPQLKKLHALEVKPQTQVIDFSQWKKQMPDGVEHLYFFPKMRCASKTDLYQTLLPMMSFATDQRLTMNTAYLARYNPVCQLEAQEIANSNPKNSVYVFTREDYSEQQVRQFFPKNWRVQCYLQDFASICSVSDVRPQ